MRRKRLTEGVTTITIHDSTWKKLNAFRTDKGVSMNDVVLMLYEKAGYEKKER